MKFDIITIFPKIFNSYFSESIIKRAREKKLIEINVHDLRAFSTDKHKKADDKPYGGGPGMVLKIEPIVKAVASLRLSAPPWRGGFASGGKNKKQKTTVILFTPGGKQFDNKKAAELAGKNERLILICGRYEGVDERVKKAVRDMGLKVEEISIGPYVLTGGELPAMVLVDAVSRRIPGVLGKEESLEEKRHGVGVPVYTRPEIFVFRGKKYRVPEVLLSGDHKKIEEWKRKRAKI